MLLPGDAILFQGSVSHVFTVGLTLTGSGTSANPIVVSSYGIGVAALAVPGATSSGISIYNAENIIVQNLTISSTTPALLTKQAGVSVYADKPPASGANRAM
jgi:hypothetical protein